MIEQPCELVEVNLRGPAQAEFDERGMRGACDLDVGIQSRESAALFEDPVGYRRELLALLPARLEQIGIEKRERMLQPD